MNKKISLGAAISIAAIIATFAVVITYTIAISVFDGRMSSVTEKQNMYNLLSEIDITVRENYYGEISESYLQADLAEGYISGLDDEYSEYLTADAYQLAVNESLGYAFGLGMEISRASDGNLLVNVVYSGSPADKAGIECGDVIVSVEGSTVLSIGYDAAVELISETSPKVSLVVNHSDEESAYELTKTKYETQTVAREIINDNIGVITIYEFNAKTLLQFNTALSYLTNQGVAGLVIDLRDSAGGDYEYACEVLDVLLPSGVIMNITDKDGNVTEQYSSTSGAIDLPMAVLINENTEGASEMFAAALVAFGKAESVGTATAGHSTVQELLDLSNGGALRLTTGKWEVPSLSEELTEEGSVLPQFEVVLTSYQQTNRYQLSAADDPQMQTALDRLELKISVSEE